MLAQVRVLTVVLALSQSVVCLTAPDQMICLHRDGQVRLERFEPSCCRGETAPSCPDEECQDIPVVDASPTDLPDAPLVLDVVAVVVEPPVESAPFIPLPTLNRPRSFSGPPPPGPEQHLATVILRL